MKPHSDRAGAFYNEGITKWSLSTLATTRSEQAPEFFCERTVDYDVNYTIKYYDLVLVTIIATMATGAAVGTLTSVALPTAVTVAGLGAVLVIAHGLFVNGPVDGPEDLTDEVDTLN